MNFRNGFSGGMKALALAGFAFVIGSTQQAKASVIIVFNPSLSSGNTFIYDYNFTTGIDAGTGSPTDRMENGTGNTVQAYGTVYDLGGFVSATLNPAFASALALSTQATGVTPGDVIPVDGPATNVTLSYLGPTVSMDTSFVGAVTVISTFTQRNPLGYFSGQDTKNAGLSAGTQIGDVGRTTVPSAVPEPASMFTFAGGAGALLFGLRRRFKK